MQEITISRLKKCNEAILYFEQMQRYCKNKAELFGNNSLGDEFVQKARIKGMAVERIKQDRLKLIILLN